MNKYVVTLMVQGEEYVINLKAKDGLQVHRKVRQNCIFDEIILIETRKEYKERTKKFNPVMTSSFQSVRTSKRAVFGD